MAAMKIAISIFNSDRQHGNWQQWQKRIENNDIRSKWRNGGVMAMAAGNGSSGINGSWQ